MSGSDWMPAAMGWISCLTAGWGLWSIPLMRTSEGDGDEKGEIIRGRCWWMRVYESSCYELVVLCCRLL